MQTPESKISVQCQTLIGQIAERFERAFRDGSRPCIEDFLASQSADLHLHLLRELLALELALRRSAGEQPAVDEYLQRFPEDRTIVEQVFMPATEMASTLEQRKDRELEPAVGGLLPERLGRYVIKRQLGKGGFGVVYLAHDPQLDRSVALKVPRRERFSTPEQVAQFIQEARTTAKLKHPLLVTIYDVQEEDALPYIVQEYIEGQNLAEWTSEHLPTFEQTVQVLLGIAEALGYAHGQRLTHCDLKLANVLMDQQGKPHVADFGLAVHESARFDRKGARFGTPPIMAPEQVRGEGHRLDGRTDIWAMGVMMYQMLVSQRPFTATEQSELFNEIETLDPRPPRQIDRRVPRELERICLKCLSKRRTERYNTMDDLREDLQLWLSQDASTQGSQGSQALTVRTFAVTPADSDPSSEQPVKIIPKGLRSFDAEDSDFFLKLLPGPRDREGLPDSIRFWKNRIEERDPDKTFSVGLIYGPSGCGKSSLVKAGLLPRLSEQVLALYVEATADETELRILKQFHKHFPGSAENISLPDACAALRRSAVGLDRKVLLVIDQFEQWLHTHTDLSATALVSALRQCDGGRLQVMLLVRDDFFASVNRLFRELDDPLLEGRNYALVDRFDRQHACKVLTAFGRAYGKLDAELSTSQKQFVSQAVEELVEEGKVISVRLSLFADMMKTRPWTLGSLTEVGGASGVGVTFLEETFSGRAAPPTHREHQAAIRQTLKVLLPESGTDLKGGMRSADSLRQASGYGSDQRRFDELLRILDSELRIITPTDPEGIENADVSSSKPQNHSSLPTSNFTLHSSRYYQLTHDYLVPSLREWLTRKQRETRRGRAELKLEERAAIWNTRRENKQLPSALEWLQFRWHTDRSKWTQTQRKMLQTAAKVHGITWGGTLAALLAIGFSVQVLVTQREWNNKREQTRIAAESLQNNLGPSIPMNIGELKKLPEALVLGELAERFVTDNSRHKLALAFALAAYGRVETEYLVSRIDVVGPADTANFVDALALDRKRALATIKAKADQCRSQFLWRRKAKLAVAALALGDSELAADMCQYEDRPDHGQRTIFIHEFSQWEWNLPDRTLDLSQLAQLVAKSRDSGWRSGISLAVGGIPLEKLRQFDPAGMESWSQLASRWYIDDSDTSDHSAAHWLLRQWKRPLPTVAEIANVETNRDWFLNSAGMTMLRIRPQVVESERVPTLVDPLENFRQQLVELQDISKEELTQEQLVTRALAYFQTGDYAAAMADLDDLESVREDPMLSLGLMPLPVFRILALSRLGKHEDAAAAYDTASETKSRWLDMYLAVQLSTFRGDYAASLDLLGQAAQDETMNENDLYNAACAAALCADFLSEIEAGTCQKFKTFAIELLEKAIRAGYSEGQLYVSQEPDFRVLHRDPGFVSLVSKIYLAQPKSDYWIASCEVTRGQFEAFLHDADYRFEKPADWKVVESYFSPTADHPAQVSWYDAVMYCNWLSRREGKSPAYRRTGRKERSIYDRDQVIDQWDLEPNATGYRLPSEAEWEFAARAGSKTAWSTGSDEQFLVDYCQMFPSRLSMEVGEKLPNAWGMHDMHGNMWEWCNDLYDGVEYHDLTGDGFTAYRIYRGGGWYSSAQDCRSTYRGIITVHPEERAEDSGFRVALSPSGVSPKAETGPLGETSDAGTE